MEIIGSTCLPVGPLYSIVSDANIGIVNPDTRPKPQTFSIL